MKTKHFFLAVLFAALSASLFAQAGAQHFPEKKSPINRHHQMPEAIHEFNIPQKGDVEPVDEFYRRHSGLNVFLAEGETPEKAQNTKDVVYGCDSIFCYYVNGAMNKFAHTRDAAGRLLRQIMQLRGSGQAIWENRSKNSYTYDDLGNELTEVQQYWENGSGIWKNQWIITSSYDASGNKISEILQKWNTYIVYWVNEYKYKYTYDASGNMLTNDYQIWDTGIGQWVEWAIEKYTYDIEGNMLTETHQTWNKQISEWVNDNLSIYTYDLAGNMLTALNRRWKTTTSAWVSYSRSNYTYDNEGNRLSLLDQSTTEGGNWLNTRRHSYTWDASRNLLMGIYETWLSGINNWVNDYKRNFTYDASGNMLSAIYQEWETGSGSWINVGKKDFNYNSKKVSGIVYLWSDGWTPNESSIELYIYKQLLFSGYCFKAEAYYSSYSLGIEDIQSNESIFFCSPNPAKDLVNVTNSYLKEANLKIYNMKGQLLNEKLLNTGQNEISVQNLTPGVYLFVMQSENSRIQNKVVVY